MKSFKAISLILLALVVCACGRGLDTYHSAGLQQEGLQDGILTIPQAGVSSGRTYINQGSSGFYVDLEGSDPESIAYLYRLQAREISVSRTELSNGTLYSIRFIGTVSDGPCPFSASLTCSLVQLSAIVAY